MTDKVFADTNVLVYAYNRSEPVKQQRAFQVLDRLAVTSLGAVSTQVLSEMFVTLSRELAAEHRIQNGDKIFIESARNRMIPAPLQVDEAYDRLRNYTLSWTVLEVTAMIVLEAARGVRDHRFNYWDSLIWATARLNQIALVLSEDFGHMTEIEGVRFVNPFASEFRLEEWMR